MYLITSILCHEGLLPPGVDGVDLVLRNSCGQSFSFRLHGPEVEYTGEGDLHNPKYDEERVFVDIVEHYPNPELVTQTPGHCVISLDVYPSDTFYAAYHSSVPVIVATVAACLFAIKAALFGLYDLIVQTRNHKVTTVAVRSNAIVSSLFPEAVKERLLAEKDKENENLLSDEHMSAEEQDENGVYKSKPIADLYPEATVLCKSSRCIALQQILAIRSDSFLTALLSAFFSSVADVEGFTEWSSGREPCQVFTLLETLYAAFDKIADQRRIYKVETVGKSLV